MTRWPRPAAALGAALAVLVLAWARSAYRARQSPPEGGWAAVDYEPLRRAVQAYARSRPQRFGIYFRDLVSGLEWGYQPDEPIPAASTVKVPIALYVNHLVADRRRSWSDRIIYRRELDFAPGAGVLQYQGVDGQGYTLRVLTNLLITISDNVAWRMLERELGRDNIAAFMRRLGGRTVYPDGKNITTARDMGTYLAAVLDFARRHPAPGERLLDDLSHTIWDVGLSGLLPAGVRVAHKEGEITGVADDVGIVFARRPYILCILSEEVQDLNAGFQDIARISRMVFDFQEQLPAGPSSGS